MLLGRNVIVEAISRGHIKAYRNGTQLGSADLVIGTNSVDVTLSRKFIKVCAAPGWDGIDPWEPESLGQMPVEADKYRLSPGETILGCTQERFDIAPGFFALAGDLDPIDIAPMYDGRSTCGRLFLASHITAGYGDVGFQSAWTLELKNMGESALLLRAGMRIGQVSFQAVLGGVGEVYHGAYTDQDHGPKAPVLGPARF